MTGPGDEIPRSSLNEFHTQKLVNQELRHENTLQHVVMENMDKAIGELHKRLDAMEDRRLRKWHLVGGIILAIACSIAASVFYNQYLK